MQDAAAATRVFPLLLNHPIVVAKAHIPLCMRGNAGRSAQTARNAGVGGAKGEVALVGVFLAAGIKPGIQVRVGDGFKLFVREDVDHAIRAAHTRGRAVGTGGLDFTGALAAVRVADECILNVSAIERRMGMEAAILGAESGRFVDVGGAEYEIHAPGIGGQ